MKIKKNRILVGNNRINFCLPEGFKSRHRIASQDKLFELEFLLYFQNYFFDFILLLILSIYNISDSPGPQHDRQDRRGRHERERREGAAAVPLRGDAVPAARRRPRPEPAHDVGRDRGHALQAGRGRHSAARVSSSK